MAAELNCSACETLRQEVPSLVVNGFDDTMCASLKNDTGLSASSGHKDCADLDNLNDCLIGNMANEVDAYDVCDWKDFMKSLIPNIWTTIKAIICAICGIWTNIHNLWKLAEKIDCILDYMGSGASFSFSESTSGVSSKLVPGKGCDFSLRSASQEHSADIVITYIAGGLCILSGSLRTFTESFVDADGNTKSGNSVWNFASPNFPKGGELMYEIRIKKSEYPQIKRFFPGHAFETGAANQDFTANILYFNEGSYAYGQHGWCNSNGAASESGYSDGHLVPDGWMYIQMRMASVAHLSVGSITDGSGTTKSGTDFSPRGFLGIRINQDAIDC